MLVHSALHSAVSVGPAGPDQSSTHGPDSGRVQECRAWADHAACALVSRRVLDLFLGLEGRGRAMEKQWWPCKRAVGQTRELSLNPSRNADVDQDTHSERQLIIYSICCWREGERKPSSVPSHVQKGTTLSSLACFTGSNSNSFYDFCNLGEITQMQP